MNAAHSRFFPNRVLPGLVALVAAWSGVARLAALDPTRPADSYSIRGWSTEHGLPSERVRALTQTRDGYLWSATSQGIARFDGSHFTAFTDATHPILRAAALYATLATPDGAVWFGGDVGILRWHDGQFEHHALPPTGVRNHVRSLFLAGDGTIVAGTRHGFLFLRNGRLEPDVVWPQVTGIARSYLERANGAKLVGTDEGLWQITGDRIERLSGTPEFPGTAFYALLETPDGTLWIGYSGGVRRLRPDGSSDHYGMAEGLTNPRVRALRLDRDGNMWIATIGGLYRLTGDRLAAVDYPRELGGATIQQLYEDQSGSIWIAASTGLFRLTDNVSSSIGIPEGLLHTSVYAMLESRDGAWWIATWNGGIYRYENARATRLPAAASVGLEQTRALAEEPDGTLWIGSNTGLYRYAAGGITNFYRADQAAAWQQQIAAEPGAVLPGVAHSWVNAMVGDGAGGLWVATDGALYHRTGEQFRAYTAASGLPGNVFKSAIRSSEGDIWVTAPPLGVARLRAGRWENFLCGQELASANPRAVYEDTRGTIWVTSEGGGLNRFKDGQWRTITTREGLADNFISGIVDDAAGNYWLAFPRGIMRIPHAEFDELAAGRRTVLQPHLFNRFDGLPASETNPSGMPNATRTRDGRVLFATDRGVAVIDPANVRINNFQPPVYIERLVVNGADAALGREVVVPPGRNDVQLHYTAVNLLAPEKVRFQIRLHPLDREWVDTGARRDVRYAKLPAGNYTFHVRATDHSGAWHEKSVATAFVVQPYFYQTGWFLGLAACVTVGVSLGIYRTRVRLARHQMNVLAKLVDERTRELRAAKDDADDAVRAKTEVISALKLAQEETAREKARFKFIFDSVPVGISWIVRGANHTHLVNPAHIAITGVPAEQRFDPENYRRATHAEDCAREDALHARLIAGEIDHYTVEKRCLHPDGSTAWAVRSVRSYHDEASGETQELNTFVDITERKRAEMNLAETSGLLEAMLENSPDMIYFKDRESRFVRYSRAFSKRFDIADPNYLRGRTDFDLFTDEHARPAFENEQEIIRTGRPLIGLLEKETYVDGRVTWALTTKMPWHDGHGAIVGTFGISKDVTAIKEAEAKLAETHKQLMEISRQAGMAEVATGVLHNVGNVLNSVNVSTTLLTNLVNQSKISRVTKLAELFREQGPNLGAFFAHDARALQVPGFIESLSKHLAGERADLLAELASLQKNIDHIKDIVAMQQNYAKVSGVCETVSVVDLIEDALHMSASGHTRQDVALTCDFRARPMLTVEKHKVLQILVNLMRNAKNACDESGQLDKRMTVRVSTDQHRVLIAIADNGVGIPPENLTRIFAHGFTTRKHGHGFGLHSGALAAKELGGALHAYSDGPGQGATFTLELPHKPEARAA